MPIKITFLLFLLEGLPGVATVAIGGEITLSVLVLWGGEAIWTLGGELRGDGGVSSTGLVNPKEFT